MATRQPKVRGGRVPLLVEREVKPKVWQPLLAVLGSAVFVGSGVWLLMSEDVLQKIGGAADILFFGWAGLLMLRAVAGGRGRLRVRRQGLELPVLATFGAVGVLPWEDIASFGVVSLGRQSLTAIRLLRSDRFLGSLSAKEADATVRYYGRLRPRLRLLGYAAAVIGVTHLDDPTDLMRALSVLDPVDSIAQLLARQRAAYGAELLLGWNMRDRSAPAFAEYLGQCQRAALSG